MNAIPDLARTLGNVALALLVLLAILHVADRLAYGLAVQANGLGPEAGITLTTRGGQAGVR